LRQKLKKIGINEPSLVIDSGYGYHVYIKLQHDIDIKKWRRLQELFIGYLGGDEKTKDPARILRVAGTYNPRYYQHLRPVKIVAQGVDEADPEDLLKKLEGFRPKPSTTTGIVATTKLRLLKDSEVLKVKELLKPFYRPGQRQFLCFFLAGHGAHSKIHPVSIAQIIKLLHEEMNDEEKLEQRLSVIPYSYKKLQLWSPDIENEFLQWLQANDISRISGISYQPSEEDMEKGVKGSGGLFKLLKKNFGNNEEAETKANEVLRQLSEIFSKGKFDLICELIDYEKQLYVCAHMHKRVIARMRRKENKLILKEKIFPIVPNNVVMYIDPISNSRKFELEVVGDERILPKSAKIGPADSIDIVAWLRTRGLCYHSRLAEDCLNAILSAYLKRGIAEIKEEIERLGFYLVNSKVIAVGFQVKDVTRDELREALILLNELATKWYTHIIEKFSMIIKWGIVAPFSFIYKQMGKWIPWLCLYGSSYTGKTTLGEIDLSLWGLGAEHKKSGASIDTVPRLGHVLSLGTFPVLINEPGVAILREDVVETMKSAVESTIARGKYIRGSYMEIPALAPLLLTSNKVLPHDDALLRRLMLLVFTYGERIDPAKAKEFDRDVRPSLGKLKVIGYYVAKKIAERPELLEKEWIELAEELLESAYNEAGLDIPQRIKLRIEHNPMQIYDDMREAIRNFLIKRINEEYNRYVGRIEVIGQVEQEDVIERIKFLPRHDVTLPERVHIVLNSNLIPWCMLRGEEVIITSGFVEELKKIIGDIGGLKSIAELLGWTYYPKRSFRIGKKVRNIACISVDIKEFISLLIPEEVRPETNESSSQ